MSDFKFSCPHCDQHIACDTSLSGRQLQCPACHHLIRVPPAPGTNPKDYTPESGMTWQTFIAPKKPPGKKD